MTRWALIHFVVFVVRPEIVFACPVAVTPNEYRLRNERVVKLVAVENSHDQIQISAVLADAVKLLWPQNFANNGKPFFRTGSDVVLNLATLRKNCVQLVFGYLRPNLSTFWNHYKPNFYDINDPRCFASVVKVDRAFHPFGRIQLQILGTIDTNPRPIFKFHLLDLLFHVFKRCCGLTDLIAAKVDLLLNGFPLIISNSCYYSSECDHHPAWPAKLHNRAQQRSDEDDSQSIEPFLSLVAKMLAIFLGGKLALEAAYKALQKTNWQIGQRVIACLGCFAVFFAIAFQIVVSIKW